MSKNPSRRFGVHRWFRLVRAVYRTLEPRACVAIMYGALFCTLAVKFFHAVRYGLVLEYPGWILTDVAVLLTIAVVLDLICYRRPTTWVLRGATTFAAVVCTWSVMNAGWLIRTGSQILPAELRPLVRDPLDVTVMVLKNFVSMPIASVALLLPSAIALAFFFSVLARPQAPRYDPRRFRRRVAVSLIVIVVTGVAGMVVSFLGPRSTTGARVRFNSQVRAVLSVFLPAYRQLAPEDFRNATRELLTIDDADVRLKSRSVKHNVVIVVLEGVQQSSTSLATDGSATCGGGGTSFDPTPHLAQIAAEGVVFTSARSAVAHTTKALFGLLTGQLPSASQEIAETVPVPTPYAGLATILEKGLGYRTAFFQSAKGTFESRPGLVYNLGFDKFFTREDLKDPNSFVGSLGADEFALLEPITEWITSAPEPFLLVMLCSVTHDPYEVPEWFGLPAEDLVERYRQTIRYTDRFLAALDVELTRLRLADDTIFVVAGDHGEAFAEHHMMGHERIAYEEVLHVPLCLRAPFLVEAGRRITAPVSSVDLTPTILALLGFDTERIGFDGADALGPLPADRRVYFSGWMQQGPAGFVTGSDKVIYEPEHGTVTLYRLAIDPLELNGLELPEEKAQRFQEEIMAWRRNTIFRVHQERAGQKVLFGSWRCKWNERETSVKYRD
jgi:hypothetical protein